MRRIGFAGVCVAMIVIAAQHSRAQTSQRLEYRVVYATARQLARQLDEAGRAGFGCVAVARSEPGLNAPALAVVLGRPVGASLQVSHRVVPASGAGTDLQAVLERSGTEGFHLCGIALDEGATTPSIVAVMTRPTGESPAWHYGVEVLTNYKRSLVSLNAAAKDGMLPVAASPINNNRVPEMRSWLVVTEREGERIVPREIAVRSDSGADGFQRVLNEQGGQGYRADLIWKEGNDVVAMMSRETAGPKRTFAYATEAMELARLHSLSRIYVADVPYLTSGARLVISDRAASATTDVEEDPLPALGRSGYADATALVTIGDHLTRHRDAAPMSARLSRGANGSLVMTTIVASAPRDR